jgi:hypothetical protein
MDLPQNVFERDAKLNELAKDFFKIDFENSEFHIVMQSALISILLKKGIFTEEEFARETEETGTAYKLMKYRNSLQQEVDKAE